MRVISPEKEVWAFFIELDSSSMASGSLLFGGLYTLTISCFFVFCLFIVIHSFSTFPEIELSSSTISAYALSSVFMYCKRRNFRAVHIFAHFAQCIRCAKI